MKKWWYVIRQKIYSHQEIYNPKLKRWDTMIGINSFAPYAIESYRIASQLAAGVGGYVMELEKTDNIAYEKWIADYEGR